jgi:hypothetical protein
MISLETVAYWPKAQKDWEENLSIHNINSFEQWVKTKYRCRLSFSEFETSAAFVFDNDKDATLFILRYGTDK